MKTLILICSAGTPQLNSINSVRTYLKNFLSDRNVVDLPPLLWKPILNGIILKKYPEQSLKKYQQISILGKNPMDLYFDALVTKLNAKTEEFIYKKVYAYTHPYINEVLENINFSVIKHIIVFPLYIHYSKCTHTTIYTQVNNYLNKNKINCNLILIKNIFTDPNFIKLYTKTLIPYIKANSQLLVSCHSVPIKLLQKGDPYAQECQAFASKLKSELQQQNINNNLKLCYHSTFGKGKWLGPSIYTTLDELLEHKITNVTVSAGFCLDGLETLYDLDLLARQYFLAKGGRNFNYIPCLNDSDAHIAIISSIVQNQLAKFK